MTASSSALSLTFFLVNGEIPTCSPILKLTWSSLGGKKLSYPGLGGGGLHSWIIIE